MSILHQSARQNKSVIFIVRKSHLLVEDWSYYRDFLGIVGHLLFAWRYCKEIVQPKALGMEIQSTSLGARDESLLIWTLTRSQLKQPCNPPVSMLQLILTFSWHLHVAVIAYTTFLASIRQVQHGRQAGTTAGCCCCIAYIQRASCEQ